MRVCPLHEWLWQHTDNGNVSEIPPEIPLETNHCCMALTRFHRLFRIHVDTLSNGRMVAYLMKPNVSWKRATKPCSFGPDGST